ncbi:nucleotidyl transferase AbiEii/AbiGii toxin family protein [Trinickia dinghuensis]|uniref:Nucleotidyl transferase AbiEii/AbiGii toxin family protein n=1 Tax=Trinickia dinghuensis TaxID=2291023 RepID=A0A3D8K4R6_9BURK|nr:nucleotidyl transferase AbiEii/AbiGii toxin family protein [Trinickia dinghuensis]RDU99581.1 nucleotidyl transferase AbiEii/AbiGii toxin family protein [Trinickia dinghuensis]
MNRNLAASIRARLKQHADAAKQDFNLTLTQYGLERLLYRLSISRHADNYLLKGALLFSLWYDQPHRPTRDADLLGYCPDDIDTTIATFREIGQIEVEDGIAFEPGSVRGSEIRKEAGYGGVRIDLQAKLDGARIALQVDIGFGDAVTPVPEPVSYPVLLDDLPAPQLRAYPKYTVVAEKFHAVCLLGMANTRMKDYFDLWVLLTEETLDPAELRRAVQATFARRRLAIPEAIGITAVFAVPPPVIDIADIPRHQP